MDLACQIAHKTGCELIALHVLDHTGLFDFSAGSSTYPLMGNPAGLDLDQKFLELLYSNAEDKCAQFLKSFESEHVKITRKIKSQQGNKGFGHQTGQYTSESKYIKWRKPTEGSDRKVAYV